MKRYVGVFVFGAGIPLLATTALGNHLDREIEAVKGQIEQTVMEMQRAQTLGVMGTGEHRGRIAAEQDDLAQFHKRLKELEGQAQKDHAAQKK